MKHNLTLLTALLAAIAAGICRDATGEDAATEGPACKPAAPALVAAAERIAQRFVAENRQERNYRFDLALEALLELSEATGKPVYREHALRVIAKRGWTPATEVPFNEQSFTCLTFGVYRSTGDREWLPVFLRQSERCRREKPRTVEGAVTHPRGKERGGGNAMLLDDMQEFVARMARAGRLSGDDTYYREAAEQIRLYRAIARDPATGLWHQGRGWLSGQPQAVSPGAWSRGHGWLLRGLSTAVTEIPRERPEFGELRTVCRELADALLMRQQPGGLWPCLLDREPGASPLETSGSAMIATALSRMWRAGVLTDAKYRDAARRTFAALPAYVDPDGLVLSTSPGPGPLESEANYFTASFPPGNDHGTFAIMFAASEAVNLDRRMKDDEAKR